MPAGSGQVLPYFRVYFNPRSHGQIALPMKTTKKRLETPVLFAGCEKNTNQYIIFSQGNASVKIEEGDKTKDNLYFSHLSEDGTRRQTLNEHLTGTAELAGRFAEVWGAEQEAWITALCHDIGKTSAAFQRRLLENGKRVDHATAGAQVLFRHRLFHAAACAAGHHAGLSDNGSLKTSVYGDGTLCGKLKAKEGHDIEPYEDIVEEKDFPNGTPKGQPVSPLDSFLYTKMLYSALTDADFLDTEQFMSGEKPRGQFASIAELNEKLERFIAGWKTDDSEINALRTGIRRELEKRSELPSGAFTLTVPTGGGKTISSMRFALLHALKNGLRRVIYVIPYTSVIEQTQKVFEEIFGSENVLAHYAVSDFYLTESGEAEETEEAVRKRLAAENWDAPIIVTTSVRFFESFFSCRSTGCRKLHNVAGSVLIFDEAQTLPTAVLRPCLYVISQLIRRYRCSGVLCTATQPAVERILHEKEMLGDLPVTELCPEPERMYEAFRRVVYRNEGVLSDEALIERLGSDAQVLCIVNTKAHARKLYEMLPKEGRFHLSTNMTPKDRHETLEVIRRLLKENKPCRVVSTSLIEAGVDVDFPAVWRALAGSDSIIQAGGRCNREGKRSREESIVHYFIPESEKQPTYLRQNLSAAERVIEREEDVASPSSVRTYFEFLFYILKGEFLDEKKILKQIAAHPFDFRTIGEQFHMIEAEDRTVVIPCEENRGSIASIRSGVYSRNTLRKLGYYSVNVPGYVFDSLLGGGALELLDAKGSVGVLTDAERYDKECGLNTVK